MTIPEWIRPRRITGLGALLMLAMMSAGLLAGPVAAHHCKGSHDFDGCVVGGGTGGVETATFEMDASGNLVGSVEVTQKANVQSIIHNIPQAGEVFELDMAGFFAKNTSTRPDWDECFAGDGTFSVEGGVIAEKNDTNTGQAGFHFTAKGTDGTTDVKYKLVVTFVTIEPPSEAIWPNWLPALNETATVTTVPGAPWEVSTTNGPGKKVACTGDGTTGKGTDDTLDFAIAIERIS